MDDSDAFSKTLETKRRQQSRQSINRLSRAFESTHLDKPVPPSKPVSLREQTKEEVSLSFNDIRAKFQHESSIPIQPKVNKENFPKPYIFFRQLIDHPYP